MGVPRPPVCPGVAVGLASVLLEVQGALRCEWSLALLIGLFVGFCVGRASVWSRPGERAGVRRTFGERKPGARLLVQFEGAAWTHERLLLWPVHRERRVEPWVVETPDADRYVENVELEPLAGARVSGGVLAAPFRPDRPAELPQGRHECI